MRIPPIMLSLLVGIAFVSGLSPADANSPLQSPANQTSKSEPHQAKTKAQESSQMPIVVNVPASQPSIHVTVPEKSWVHEILPSLIAALVSGGILLIFSYRLQKALLRLSRTLTGQGDLYFRFGERGMEAQFLLFKAQAIRREPAHPDWQATALALQDKEAAIRALSGPILSYFDADPEIGTLYSQFLDLYIQLKRTLIHRTEWDQAAFERDQDSLNDMYGEAQLRMGAIIESGKPVPQHELENWRRAVAARREEMHQW
ncbi:hypothetical protein [Candidatus Nitrospira bockiana]